MGRADDAPAADVMADVGAQGGAPGAARLDLGGEGPPVSLQPYGGEYQLQGIMDLISVDLSEPYSIFTYRYFINNWPQLCYVAVQQQEGEAPPRDGDTASADAAPRIVGTIVCKQDTHRGGAMRGYIAMLAVHHSMRKRGMGSKLVQLAVRAMHAGGCDEAVLETEVTNIGALRLYEGLGFVRDKRLHKYYLNGNDAFRLKVWFNIGTAPEDAGVGQGAGEPEVASAIEDVTPPDGRPDDDSRL